MSPQPLQIHVEECKFHNPSRALDTAVLSVHARLRRQLLSPLRWHHQPRCILNLFDLKAPLSKKPRDGVKTTDTVVDAARNLYFRLFVPSVDRDANMPVIIYFHGGGFAYMQVNSIACDDLCRRLCKKTGAVIISVNYRLTPEHKYPCQYDDGFDIVKFIDDNANTDLGNLNLPSYANLKQCFIAGDSAVGNLAHHVAVKACEYELRNVELKGLMTIQPFFESDLDHPACNVFGPKSGDNISRLEFPATMVVVGGVDPLHDWQIRYYEGLKKCGKEAYLIEYPNAFHSFYGLPELEDTALVMEELKNFVRKSIKEL
ncbi:hypothetical protein F3Y22_tig00110596pilonHSYRG00025 [Hibiscus syriacus]|uniref:Alpha/beta hydrolase fold-3 domain-containing protein n=1 Tax=Hibiscus syriacus TaxID=106335 RepID=A0A6A3A467_HIBSY|nr:hypothetical protein F3Y22_tig00110596pilonHSYRG00025 [Hibiscus syriacus]